MFENEGVSKIPWRSKRTVANINEMNAKGRETGSGEELDRVGKNIEEEPLPEDPVERCKVMMDFIRALPQVQEAVMNLRMPSPGAAVHMLNLAGLRAELELSDRAKWREQPFYYLAVGVEFEQQEKALQERLRLQAEERERVIAEHEERGTGWLDILFGKPTKK